MTLDSHPIHKLATLATSLLGIVAVLALAAPAVAHDHGESGFDDDPAGTIASYDADSGRLAIDLADGGSISGLVSRFTRIEAGDDDNCDDRRGRRQVHDWCRRRQLHGSEHGEDHDWHHDRGGSTGDLVEGAVVDDALLVLKDGRAFYAKVELAD
jgi:hypothetical protein